jgi:hypothetical protein
MAYHSLTSEKYLEESMEKEHLIWQKKIRRQQLSNLITNLLAIFGVTMGVYLAVTTMPTWLPSVVNKLYTWGVF